MSVNATDLIIASAGASEDTVGVAVSNDGRYVLMHSTASGSITGADGVHSQVYLRDMQAGTTTLVSVGSAGQSGDDDSLATDMSSDGRWIVFTSTATNLDAGDVDPGKFVYLGEDVYLHDRVAGTTSLVSVPAPRGEPYTGSDNGHVSEDGRFVVYDRFELLPGSPPRYATNVYLHDTLDGTDALLSANASGLPANGRSHGPTISDDGARIAFSSEASDLVTGDTNGVEDVFVLERVAGTLARASVAGDGAQANGPSAGAAISGDGGSVGFGSRATNLAGGGPGAFVRRLAAGVTVRADAGAATLDRGVSIDARGRAVARVSSGSAEASPDVVLHLTDTASESLPTPPAGNTHDGSFAVAISGDGGHVAVTTRWQGPGDAADGGAADVFLQPIGTAPPSMSLPTLTVPPDEWVLATLPGAPPGGATPEALFGDELDGVYGTDWIVFTYDVLAAQPDYVDPGPAGPLRAGQGFWLIHTNAAPAELALPSGSIPFPSGGSPVSTCAAAGCHAVALGGAAVGGPGDPTVAWFMIGNPGGPLDYDALRVTTAAGACAPATGGCTLAQAQAADLVGDALFAFPPGAVDYLPLGAGDRLAPWEGYWLPVLPGSVASPPTLRVPAG